jgi:hypothetical protein
MEIVFLGIERFGDGLSKRLTAGALIRAGQIGRSVRSGVLQFHDLGYGWASWLSRPVLASQNPLVEAFEHNDFHLVLVGRAAPRRQSGSQHEQ